VGDILVHHNARLSYGPGHIELNSNNTFQILVCAKNKKPTIPRLPTSGRMTVNDHVTLAWCYECPSGDAKVVGFLEHACSNIRGPEK